MKDSVFERMSFDQWKRAVTPKVVGTTTLGKHLPNDMDFFVLFSSLAGVVRHVSQANYFAGNAFQAAFARHRVAQAVAVRLSSISNLEADSIDLGQASSAYGVDSLVAVALRNWLALTGGAKLSIFEILQSTSLHEISTLIMTRKIGG